MIRIFLIASAAVTLSAPAWAQAVVAAPAPFLDLTGIATAVIAGVFGVLGVVIPLWLQSRIKDKDAAATLTLAVKNSLGAIQQAATTGIVTLSPKVNLPSSTSPGLVVGVQYVLDHAGDEAARLGITQAAIASKINAQVGLASIASGTPVATPTAVVAPPPPPPPPPVRIAPVVQPGTPA